MKTIKFPKAGSFDSCLSYFKELTENHELAVQNIGKPEVFFESAYTTSSGSLSKDVQGFVHKNYSRPNRYNFIVNSKIEYLQKLFYFYNIQIDWDEITKKLKNVQDTFKKDIKNLLTDDFSEGNRNDLNRFMELSAIRVHIGDLALTLPVFELLSVNSDYKMSVSDIEELSVNVVINSRPGSVFATLKNSNITHSEWSLLKMVEENSLDKLTLETPEIDLTSTDIDLKIVMWTPTYNCHSKQRLASAEKVEEWAIPVNWLLADETLTEAEGRDWIINNAEKGLKLNYLPTSNIGRYLNLVITPDEFSEICTLEYFEAYGMLSDLLSYNDTTSFLKYSSEFNSQLYILNFYHFIKDGDTTLMDYIHFFVGSLTVLSILRRDTNLQDTHLSYLEVFRKTLIEAAGTKKHHVLAKHSSVVVDNPELFSKYLPSIYPSEVKFTENTNITTAVSGWYSLDDSAARSKFNGHWGEPLKFIQKVVEIKDIRFYEIIDLRYYADQGRYTYRYIDRKDYHGWGYCLYNDSTVYNYLDAGRLLFTGNIYKNATLDYGDLLDGENFVLFHNTDQPDMDNFSLQQASDKELGSPANGINAVFAGLSGVIMGNIPNVIRKYYTKELNRQKRERNKSNITEKINQKTRDAFADLISGKRTCISFNDITYHKDYVEYQSQRLKVDKLKATIRKYPDINTFTIEQNNFTEHSIVVDSSGPSNAALLRHTYSSYNLLNMNFDKVLDNFIQLIDDPYYLLNSEYFISDTYFKKHSKKAKNIKDIFTSYLKYKSEIDVVYTLTLGDVTFEVRHREKISKSGAKQTYWYICGEKINKNDVETILTNALCFTHYSDFERYVQSVNKVPIKYQKLIESGVTFQLRDSVFQLFNTPLSLQISRDKSTNYLVHKEEKYRIRNSTKFLHLVTRSKVSREQEGIKYATFELNEFLNIVLDSEIVEDFPAKELHNLITEAITRYVDTIVDQRKAIAQVERTFKLSYGNWTMDDGKNVTGYQIKGKLANYIINFDKSRSLSSINPMVYDYPSGKYRCMIDKASSLTPVGALVNRVYALHNDSMLSSHIDTLTD